MAIGRWVLTMKYKLHETVNYTNMDIVYTYFTVLSSSLQKSHTIHYKCVMVYIYILSSSTIQVCVVSSAGYSQILSCSRGEKSGEGLGWKLRHGPEMVDSVSIKTMSRTGNLVNRWSKSDDEERCLDESSWESCWTNWRQHGMALLWDTILIFYGSSTRFNPVDDKLPLKFAQRY